MYPPQRIVTNFPKVQIVQAIRDIERSIEVDRAEISLYKILEQKLVATSVTAVGEARVPMGVDFALREKDQMITVLRGLVQKEYDEINGKQEVIAFLNRLLSYAS